MANPIGYSQLYSDRPGSWLVDGYVSVDGYAEPDFSTVPSGIVESIVLNSTGNYSIVLKEPWYALLFAEAVSEIPAGLSPGYVACQLQSDDVGTAVQPSIKIQFHVAGTPTNLPAGSGFRFLLILKVSSA